MLVVNCLIHGRDPNDMATVEVRKPDWNRNIDRLKELIKTKMRPGLDHLPASTLRLWKVDFSLDDPKLQNFVCDDKTQLKPIVKLKKTFNDGDEEHIHVIIKLPGMSQ